jgi:LacI family repressor for deo operon, udp, cdd, tsx, nupC, and nupG
MADIRTVAAAAGVSIATVSRVLKTPDVVTKATRDKVMAAVEATGYRPNALASGLRRAKSDNIVVVVPFIQNPFFSGVIQGIEGVAFAEGYQVLLGESQNDQARLDSYASMLRSKTADGLILLGAALPSHIPDKTPLVMACEYFPDHRIPAIRIDNEAAARLATDHLIGLGHRRIGKIAGPIDNPLSRDRLAGYRAALAAAGLAFDETLVVEAAFDVESGHAAMTTLLDLPEPPSAVFSSSDEMAIGALKAAREHGKRVPDDLSLVGFDGIRFADFCDPPLTTVVQPNVEIGAAAARMMIGMLKGGEPPLDDIVLPASLLVRQSTAAFRAGG